MFKFNIKRLVMETLNSIFGKNTDPLVWQMLLRAVISFIATLVLLRIGGSRILGGRSGFDAIIMIMMGSVLARGIVGASSLVATIASAAVMIGIHRLLGWCCFKYPALEQLVKGKPLILYKNGKLETQNLKKASLTENDMYQSARLELKTEKMKNVRKACMETDGRISFVTDNDTDPEPINQTS